MIDWDAYWNVVGAELIVTLVVVIVLALGLGVVLALGAVRQWWERRQRMRWLSESEGE